MYSEIGAKIHELRIMKRISAKSLADKVGITTQQMYKYEKGINRIPISRLVVVAQTFDKPLEYFIATSNDQFKTHDNIKTINEKPSIADDRNSILFSITSPATRLTIKKNNKYS